MKYTIGLHVVQFGNNWMRKVLRTAKLDLAVRGIFLTPVISKLYKHVALLPTGMNFIVHKCKIADFAKSI